MKLHSNTAPAILVLLFGLSCTKELPDLQSDLSVPIENAVNNNIKKALPRSIKHSFSSYIYTWNFLYNRKGEVDSINVLAKSEYYGEWHFGYKVFYSNNKIDSVIRTSFGRVDARLINIRYHGTVITGGDFYRSDHAPIEWEIKYEQNKRPINSPIGERFYYDSKGNLISYTHPISPQENAWFESNTGDNPIHRIPNLNLILLDHFQMAYYWYNPHTAISITYADGRTVQIDNRYDHAGNLVDSYWSNINNDQWHFTYE